MSPYAQTFEPDGTVILISGVPFASDYKDTRLFSSVSEQTSYFQSKTKMVYENCSYTRSSIPFVSVDANIEDLWPYNYLMYQNESMGNKWFYAFIDHLEMKAASTTWVYFTIDVVQTWMFETSFKQCLIERQHVGIQKLGDKFYVPENLEIGTDYVTVHEEFIDAVSTNTDGSAILVTSTLDLESSGGTFDAPVVSGAEGGVFHRLPAGCNYYVIAPDVYGDASVYDFFNAIKDYPWVSKNIIGMTIVPKYMLNGMRITTVPIADTTYYIGKIADDSAPPDATIFNDNVFSYFDSVAQYKMLMYPYAFIELSCQNGNTLIIKPQYLTDTNLIVNRAAVLSMSPEVKYYLNSGYCGLGNGYDYSLTIGDFPQCPVQDTSYLLSVAQTQHDIKYDAENNVLSNLISGLASAQSLNFSGIASSVTSMVRGAEQALYKFNQANAQSPTLASQQGGTAFNYATEKMGLTIRWKMIANDYQRILEGFWKKFGYAWNMLQTPDPTKMSRFDYLKTQDCKLDGTIPQDDKVKLLSIYNNGITFWHDDNIGFYENNEGVK